MTARGTCRRTLIRRVVKLRGLALCVCLASGTGSANAGQVESGTLADLGPFIRIGGVISSGDETRFHQLLEQSGNSVVILSGPGGAVAPAMRIGNEIRANGLTTLVPADTSCASACALIWVAGQKRQMGSNARVGLHAMSIGMAGGRHSETHAGDGMLRSYLTALGYAGDATATMVNTPAAMVRWMDAGELNANGIDTESVP